MVVKKLWTRLIYDYRSYIEYQAFLRMFMTKYGNVAIICQFSIFVYIFIINNQYINYLKSSLPAN